MPFDAATGAVEQSFTFMPTNFGSFDLSWYNLYESGGIPDNPDRGLGTNWSARQIAEVLDDGLGHVCVMFAPGRNGCGGGPGGGGRGPSGPGGGGGGSCGSGDGILASTSNTYWFVEEDPPETPGPQTYGTCFGCLASLTRVAATIEIGDPPDDYRLVEVDGTVTVFDGSNMLIKSQTTPGGQVTEFYHASSPDRIVEMRRTYEYGSSQEAIESRLFGYSAGQLQFVTLRRATTSTSPDWVNIRRTELVYYTSNETSKGNIGDLKLIKQQLPATGGTWTNDKIQLFRYYTSDENDDGYQYGLKYVLSPEGYERMTDPEGSTNVQLAPYASAFYEYDSDRRVKTVSTEGGQLTNTIAWEINDDIASFNYNMRWPRLDGRAIP